MTDFQYGVIVGTLIGIAFSFLMLLAFNYAETPVGKERP